MGTRGPIGQGNNVRQLRGNPGRRKAQDPLRAVPAIPSPPSWLDREAKAEWRRITPELHRLGLLATLDRAVLSVYCRTWAIWVKAAAALDEIVTPGRKEDRKNPAWQIYRDAAGTLIALAKEIGCSPNARLRMSPPGPGTVDEQGLD